MMQITRAEDEIGYSNKPRVADPSSSYFLGLPLVFVEMPMGVSHGGEQERCLLKEGSVAAGKRQQPPLTLFWKLWVFLERECFPMCFFFYHNNIGL